MHVLKVVVLVTSWRTGKSMGKRRAGDRSVTPVQTHGLCQGLRRAGPPLLCFKTGILPSNPKWHPQNLLVATMVTTSARACHWVWILPMVGAGEPMGWRAQGGDPAPQCWASRSPNTWWSPLTSFNLPQQNRKVWSKCAALASLLKGCLWRILFSVTSQENQLRSRAEQGREPSTPGPSGSGALEAGAPT